MMLRNNDDDDAHVKLHSCHMAYRVSKKTFSLLNLNNSCGIQGVSKKLSLDVFGMPKRPVT